MSAIPSEKSMLKTPVAGSKTSLGESRSYSKGDPNGKFLVVDVPDISIGNYLTIKESSGLGVSNESTAPRLAHNGTQLSEASSGANSHPSAGSNSVFSKNLKGKDADSPSEQMARILDSPTKISILKEIADRYIMIHYIEFYERLSLVADIASNEKSNLLIDLIYIKLEEIQKDYLLENSPLKLMLLSDNAKTSILDGIRNFRSSTTGDSVNIDFVGPVREEILTILSNTYLTKLKQRKKKDIGATGSKDIDKSIKSMCKVLDSELECDNLLRIIARQQSLENYFYYKRQKEINTYAATANSPVEKQTLKQMIKKVSKEFLGKDSPLELKISEKLRLELEEAFKDAAKIQPNLLEPLTKEVLNIMLTKSFTYYLDPVDDFGSDINLKSSIDGLSLSKTDLFTSKETSVVTSLISEVSNTSSGSGIPSIGQPKSLHKLKAAESPLQEMEKILDNPAKLKVLKEVSDKFIMIHYIDFYQRQNLIRDLSANDMNSMLLGMMNQKLDELQKDYLLDNSVLKLMLITESAKAYVIEGIKRCKTMTVHDAINIKFLDPAKDEVLKILVDSLLSKFKQSMKNHDSNSSSPAKTIASNKIDDNAVQLLIKVLDSEIESEKLIEVLARQHCMENFFYYQKQKEIYSYAATATSPIEKQTLKKMIKDVGKEFVVNNAPSELNIPSKLRSDYEDAMKEGNIQISLLEPITKEVLNMMLRNTFPTYLKHK